MQSSDTTSPGYFFFFFKSHLQTGQDPSGCLDPCAWAVYHLRTHQTGVILSVCIPDHLLWCVSSRDLFGFNTAKHNRWSLSQSPSARVFPRLCCCSKNGSHHVQKAPAHQDKCNPTSNYEAPRWRLVTHLQTRALHPFSGSASTSSPQEYKRWDGALPFRACRYVGTFLLGTTMEDFPGVKVISSEALKRQIRGIKPVQTGFKTAISQSSVDFFFFYHRQEIEFRM